MGQWEEGRAVERAGFKCVASTVGTCGLRNMTILTKTKSTDSAGLRGIVHSVPG